MELQNHLYLRFFIKSLNLFPQQKDITKWKQEFVYYQYNNDTCQENLRLNIPKLKEQIFISFNSGFKDTVEVYLNNKLLKRAYFITNFSTGIATSIFAYLNNLHQPLLKIVLPNRKIYCEIILDKRYKFLDVNRMKSDNKAWWIIFKNCIKFAE